MENPAFGSEVSVRSKTRLILWCLRVWELGTHHTEYLAACEQWFGGSRLRFKQRE